MLYDIPGRSAMRLALGTIERLAQHEQVVALKDATGDVFHGIRMMQRTGLAWYSGDDPLNLAFLAHGASGMGSVAGHAYAPEMRKMVDAVDRGDLAAAREELSADRKSTRLNSSHVAISYSVFCLK